MSSQCTNLWMQFPTQKTWQTWNTSFLEVNTMPFSGFLPHKLKKLRGNYKWSCTNNSHYATCIFIQTEAFLCFRRAGFRYQPINPNFGVPPKKSKKQQQKKASQAVQWRVYGQYHLRYNISIDSSHLIQVPVASVLCLMLLSHPKPLKVDAFPVV